MRASRGTSRAVYNPWCTSFIPGDNRGLLKGNPFVIVIPVPPSSLVTHAIATIIHFRRGNERAQSLKLAVGIGLFCLLQGPNSELGSTSPHSSLAPSLPSQKKAKKHSSSRGTTKYRGSQKLDQPLPYGQTTHVSIPRPTVIHTAVVSTLMHHRQSPSLHNTPR